MSNESNENFWPGGSKWFFRLVTYHVIGEVEQVSATEIKLKNASWVADSGRFGEAFRDGFSSTAEIEYVGTMVLGRGAVVDSAPWPHGLPTESQ